MKVCRGCNILLIGSSCWASGEEREKEVSERQRWRGVKSRIFKSRPRMSSTCFPTAKLLEAIIKAGQFKALAQPIIHPSRLRNLNLKNSSPPNKIFFALLGLIPLVAILPESRGPKRTCDEAG